MKQRGSPDTGADTGPTASPPAGQGTNAPSPAAAAAPPLAPQIRAHAAASLKLAAPVMGSRAGLLVLFTVDTLMTGRVAAEELAYLGLGMTFQVVLMLVSIGILQGSMILTSQAFGAREFRECGAIWRVAIVHAAVLGAVFGFLSAFGEPFLLAVGQDPALAAGAGPVSIQFAWGMPGMLLYTACTYFLESVGRPRVGMIVIAIGNVLNVGLNGIFIYGWGGLSDPLGAEGAVLASSIIRWYAFFGVLGYILLMRRRDMTDRFGIAADAALWWRDFKTLGGNTGKRMRRLGYPMGLAQGVETAAFGAIVLMAGQLGAEPLAAHQVTMNMITLVFMVAIGMAAGTSIRVGQAVGAMDPLNTRLAGWTGVGLIALMMIPAAFVFLLAPAWVAGLFVTEPGVIAITVKTLTVASYFIVFDCMMGVAMGALRGLGDVWVPMIQQALCFWLIAVPSAYLFAILWEGGAPGLTWGLFCGIVTAVVLQAVRFHRVSRRPLRRA